MGISNGHIDYVNYYTSQQTEFAGGEVGRYNYNNRRTNGMLGFNDLITCIWIDLPDVCSCPTSRIMSVSAVQRDVGLLPSLSQYMFVSTFGFLTTLQKFEKDMHICSARNKTFTARARQIGISVL